MKGHEIAPNAMSHDTTLSFGARALYPVIRHAAFLAGRRDPAEAVPLPALNAIAQAFGASPTATKRYMDELRKAGWIETLRPSRREPLRYIVHDSLDGKQARAERLQARQQAGHSVGHEADYSAARVGRDADYSAEAHLPIEKTTAEDGRPTVVQRVPDPGYDPKRGRRVGGRDLVWDAVVEVTGASSKASTHIVRQAVASIREEAWQAATTAGAASLPEVQGDPDAWEQILAAAVVERGREVLRLYPEGGPMAVARHWRRVEIIRAARERRDRTNGGGQSAFDVAAAELARIRGGAA